MPKTILLADDSVTIQKVVAISFASEDATVVTVDNGDDAIIKAREIRPDIVLADVVMPGKNGYEVCATLKADPELKNIPVLLLTGTFETFDESRAREVGSAGHIAKPFEAQSLIREVKRLIDESAPRAVPAPAAAPAKPAASANASDDAFDFFDDDENIADLTPPQGSLDDASDFEFQSSTSDFTFGDDDLIAPELEPEKSVPVTPAAARPAEPVDVIDADSFVDAVALDAEVEPARPAPSAAVLDADELGDSLADASHSGDQPFDFSLAEEAASAIDPLAELDPIPPVDAHDLAQATVIDPLGASGYDVSSSDLGPPMVDPQPSPAPTAPTRPDEAELTVLAPERPPGANALRDADPVVPSPAANDLTTVVSESAVRSDAVTRPPLESIAEAVNAPSDLAADLYDDPVPAAVSAAAPAAAAPPAKAAPTPAPRTPEPASVLADIEPELRRQLHDTLEKIAWESFGDLAEAIVRQAVERVESVAWEVIPRMAETLIQDEIRRMKANSEDS